MKEEKKKKPSRKIQKRKRYMILVLSAVILVSLGMLWYTSLYYRNCEEKVCFDELLSTCKKADFISIKNMTFEYRIIGKEKSLCQVEVRLLQGDLSNLDSNKLEGKLMTCSLPLGLVAEPESNLDNCHGELKEGLQDLIIQKLHTYIVQNIGKIARA